MNKKLYDAVVIIALLILSALAIFPRQKKSLINQWVSEHKAHLGADQAWGGSYVVTLYARR
jgi:hypothetical protein